MLVHALGRGPSVTGEYVACPPHLPVLGIFNTTRLVRVLTFNMPKYSSPEDKLVT